MCHNFFCSGIGPRGEAVEFASEPRGGDGQGGKPGVELSFNGLGGLAELRDLVGVEHIGFVIFFGLQRFAFGLNPLFFNVFARLENEANFFKTPS